MKAIQVLVPLKQEGGCALCRLPRWPGYVHPCGTQGLRWPVPNFTAYRELLKIRWEGSRLRQAPTEDAAWSPTIVGLKYLAYDVAVTAFTKDYRTPALLLCFIAGYAAAFAIDVACLFAASRPIADAGLAVLGTIMQSPMVLLAAGGIIAATVLIKDPPPQTGATPSPGR